MQLDEKLVEHGGVRVTYKKSIHDPDQLEDSEWGPKIYDGIKRITDPKGLLFMSEGFVADLSKPAASESWHYADIGDAEGLSKAHVWKKKKVMSDILHHRMCEFSEEQQDQWRAMNEFHERFDVSDKVPALPLTLRAGTLTPQTLSVQIRIAFMPMGSCIMLIVLLSLYLISS